MMFPNGVNILAALLGSGVVILLSGSLAGALVCFPIYLILAMASERLMSR